MAKTQIDIFRGSKWEDVMKEIQNQYEKFDILEADTKRQMPFFWKKEYFVKVTGQQRVPEKQTIEQDDDPHRQMILSLLEEDEKERKLDEKKQTDKEIEGMKEMIQTLVNNLEKKEKGFLQDENEQVLKRFYESLMENEVEESVARTLITEVQNDLNQIHWLNDAKVEEKLKDFILKRMNVFGAIDADQVETIALIGPTGVGKTTTLAKIAGNLKSEGKRIGLISTDVYRIAAIEQLDTYAKILDSTMKSASTPQELRDAIDYFKYVERVDHILIDTVGRSPMLSESVENIKEYLDIAQPDHTALVLSSTQKSKDMTQILKNFREADIHSLIFTKLDETLTYGFLLNVLTKSDVKISYTTNGQNVPQDIKVATAEGLTEKVLNGVMTVGSSSLSS